MEKRIDTIEGFTIYGLEMKGSAEEIPALWDTLNAALHDRGIQEEVAFGVTVKVLEGEFQYIAGIANEQAADLPGFTSLTVPGGRFIIGRVEGGNQMIPAMFDTLMQTPDVDMRDSYGFERYIHPDPAKPYETEVWVPIER